MIHQMDVKQLKEIKDQVELIDVREQDEWDLVNIGGKLIPLSQLDVRFSEIDKSKKIVVMCHHGGRSMRACQFLESQGFEELYNVEGGIHHWSLHVDPNVQQY